VKKKEKKERRTSSCLPNVCPNGESEKKKGGGGKREKKGRKNTSTKGLRKKKSELRSKGRGLISYGHRKKEKKGGGKGTGFAKGRVGKGKRGGPPQCRRTLFAEREQRKRGGIGNLGVEEKKKKGRLFG